MLVHMPTQPLALAQINERNRQFWKEQNNLRDTRISDTAIFRTAMHDLESEQLRQIPVYFRESLEKPLEDSARAKQRCDEQSKGQFQTEFSRKGGKAPKTDALQRWIRDIVRAEPNMNTRQLLFKIRSLAKSGDSIFNQVDRKSDGSVGQHELIHFGDGGEDKTAPVSGLKDRLFRAKKKIFSR